MVVEGEQFLNSLGSEEGQGLAEYGLILVLIAAVSLATLTVLGTGVSTMLSSLTSNL